MKASVFLDAFAACVAAVGMARKQPARRVAWRSQAVLDVVAAHGHVHARATEIMFDKLLHDLRSPGEER